MIKVITYGTFDLLHRGHINLLKRAKELGDFLIVGVTADNFDKNRGKINVKQPLIERIEAVKSTGLADKIIVEEYEGQKINDIQRYSVDIFAIGSDWEGKFDYLKDFCNVIYLPRTKGISSSEIRSNSAVLRLGLYGNSAVLKKIYNESKYVNGIKVSAIFTDNINIFPEIAEENIFCNSFDTLCVNCDAIYILSKPESHFDDIKLALQKGKHVICESPMALKKDECDFLLKLAKRKKLIIFDGIKTAYSTAYDRLISIAKSGKIGKIVSIDATCTSLKYKIQSLDDIKKNTWNSICAWGPYALLPIFQLKGCNYKDVTIHSLKIPDTNYDLLTKIDFDYGDCFASIKVAKGAKSEGSMVISGTKGYIYVPAPWWKTDYFELRFENYEENQRYFYKLDGEGIRFELLAFKNAVDGNNTNEIDFNISLEICRIIEKYYKF